MENCNNELRYVTFCTTQLVISVFKTCIWQNTALSARVVITAVQLVQTSSSTIRYKDL